MTSCYTSAVRLLLFDIDGTLLSAKGAGRRALEGALEVHFGVREGLREVALDGKTDPLIVREALARAGRRFAGLEPEFVRTYLGLLQLELQRCHDFAVMEGVQQLMRTLRRHPRTWIGLATGNIREGALLKVRRGGLQEYFRFGGFGCDAEDRTHVVRMAIQRGTQLSGGPAQDVVVIGDTPRDIQHGKQAGARVLAVATGSYSRHRLQEYGPDLAVDSLHPSSQLLQFLDSPPGSGRG